MTDERDFTALVDRATRPVLADDALVAGGLARGEQLVRRRRLRWAAGTGGLAVVAALTLALVPGQVTGGQQDDPNPAATNPTATPTETPTETPSAPPTPASALPPELAAVQRELLDGVSGDRSWLTGDGVAMLRRDVDPWGTGVGEVLLVINGPHDDPIVLEFPKSCRGAAQRPGGETCRKVEGGWLFTGPTRPDMSGLHPGFEGVTARFVGRDGSGVTVDAYNSTAPESAPTRKGPVLTVEQLAELVTDPGWFTP